MVLSNEQMKCVSWCELMSVRFFVKMIFAHEQGLSTQGKTSPFCFIIALCTKEEAEEETQTSYTPVFKKKMNWPGVNSPLFFSGFQEDGEH